MVTIKHNKEVQHELHNKGEKKYYDYLQGSHLASKSSQSLTHALR